jgi:GT2 family glycosyltransferase
MKVSLCTVCMNRAQHIKQTLEKNILDNLDYAATEIILVDYNSKDDLEDYIRTHFGKYLESGKLIYYRSYTPQYFNRSHSRNIAFKMATGDIICNVDADNFTGEGFASYLNSLFGSIKNHFFYANEKFDVIGRIAVRRENFYRIGGFDERMVYYGFEDTDFMHRLVKSGLKPGIIEGTKYLSALSHSNKDRMANEYVINNYYKIFVCFLTYSSSKVLVLFKDNTFFIGTLINRLNVDTAKPDLTDQRKQYDYTIAEHRWLEGQWKEEGTSYSFSYDTDKTLLLSHMDGDLYRSQESDIPTASGTTVYYALTNRTLVEEALFFYSQLTNRMIFENNLASPEYTVNNGIFGHDIVYKNFDPTPITI